MAHSPDNATPAGIFFADIQRSISRERFSYYRRTQINKVDALAFYLYNITVSEAIYPSLQALEVVLRNSIHNALKKTQSNSAWYDIPGFLLENERKQIAEAKQRLVNESKPLDPGRIVAELTIGFWASLFSTAYTHKIVFPTVNIVFPHAPSNIRTQHAISTRLQTIRKLRNRVSHHEPIAHWPNLMREHDEIIETIGWINPSHCKYISIVDRFPELVNAGWCKIQDEVEFLFEELNSSEEDK